MNNMKYSVNIFQLGNNSKHFLELNLESRWNFSEIDEILFVLHFKELQNKAIEQINRFLPMVNTTSTIEDLRFSIIEVLNRYTAENYDLWYRNLITFENPTMEEMLTHPNEKIRNYVKKFQGFHKRDQKYSANFKLEIPKVWINCST